MRASRPPNASEPRGMSPDQLAILQRRAEERHVGGKKLAEEKCMPSTAILFTLGELTMCLKCHAIMKKDSRVQCA